MAIPLYLAMTAAEFAANSHISGKIGWMACHFSHYGTGLTNLPQMLPPGSLLIVNDRTPICCHDPERISIQLQELVEHLSPAGLLLDFQRPDISQTRTLVQYLASQISCPTAVSAPYALDGCAVFLPPVPVNRTLREHIAPWSGREIWLDLSPDASCFRVDANGCTTVPSPYSTGSVFPNRDCDLLCHYKIECSADAICFHLSRNREDLNDLLKEAENSGVSTAVGLYQELKDLI